MNNYNPYNQYQFPLSAQSLYPQLQGGSIYQQPGQNDFNIPEEASSAPTQNATDKVPGWVGLISLLSQGGDSSPISMGFNLTSPDSNQKPYTSRR